MPASLENPRAHGFVLALEAGRCLALLAEQLGKSRIRGERKGARLPVFVVPRSSRMVPVSQSTCAHRNERSFAAPIP